MRQKRRKPQEFSFNRSHLLAFKLLMELMGRIKSELDYDSVNWQNAKMTTTPVSERWNSRRIDIDLALGSSQTVSLEVYIALPTEGYVQLEFSIWIDDGERFKWTGQATESPTGVLEVTRLKNRRKAAA